MDNKEINYIEDMTQLIMVGQKKKVHLKLINWLALFGPYIYTVILFIIYMLGTLEPPSWLNWVLFVLFLPLIITSLIIGQRKHLIGAYGETILILIPTFVWLLSGHQESIKILLIPAFAIVLFGMISYFVAISIKPENSDKRRITSQVLFRIAYIGAAVVSTVVISIVLINWGDFSMKWPVDSDNHRDYTATAWVIFIAIVTVIDGVLLVILGLVSNYENIKFKKQRIKRVKDKNVDSFINKTITVKIKKTWKDRLFRR